MKAYLLDLRERVPADCDEGLKTRAVATQYRVSESWARRLLQRRRERVKWLLTKVRAVVRNRLRTRTRFGARCASSQTHGCRRITYWRSLLSYVRNHLAPTLRPGDIVVMDNLAAHKVIGVGEAIESAGARGAYMAPSSPDFAPIGLLFSKLKNLLRRDAARTVPELWDLLGGLVPVFTPHECTDSFKHRGYRNAATT